MLEPPLEGPHKDRWSFESDQGTYDEKYTTEDQEKSQGNTRPEDQAKTGGNTGVEDEAAPQGNIEYLYQPASYKGEPSEPSTVEQRTLELLPEAPLTTAAGDRFHFDIYAKVLAEKLTKPGVWPVAVGIYATWGSGKSSLLKLILDKLTTPQPIPTLSRWICRRVITSLPIAYALWVVIDILFKGILGFLKCCVPACLQRLGRQVVISPIATALSVVKDVFSGGRVCCNGNPDADVEAPQKDNKPVNCVVAEFDAWLFSDSDALWAMLISKIFAQASVIDTARIQL